jgi:hypothetical protein
MLSKPIIRSLAPSRQLSSQIDMPQKREDQFILKLPPSLNIMNRSTDVMAISSIVNDVGDSSTKVKNTTLVEDIFEATFHAEHALKDGPDPVNLSSLLRE